jgi:hypothetical protein
MFHGGVLWVCQSVNLDNGADCEISHSNVSMALLDFTAVVKVRDATPTLNGTLKLRY